MTSLQLQLLPKAQAPQLIFGCVIDAPDLADLWPAIMPPPSYDKPGTAEYVLALLDDRARPVATSPSGETSRDWKRPFVASEIGEALPDDARILLHEHQLRLGLGHPVVTDFTGYQTRFAYQDIPTPRALYELYRELGVTHLLWEPKQARGFDTLGGDLRFWQFVARHTGPQKRYGKLTVAPLGEPPAPSAPDVVAYLSCDATYQRGLDPFLNTYNFLDHTPLGRREDDGIMHWVRHRDRY